MSRTEGSNFWPPKPGITLITRTASTSSRNGSIAESGVGGFSASEARQPAAWIRRIRSAGSGTASMWTMMTSQPALTKSSR